MSRIDSAGQTTKRRPLFAGVVLLMSLWIASACVASEATNTGAPQLMVATGVVNDGAEGDGIVWFSLYDSDLRFEAPIDAIKDPDALFAAAKDSADHNVDLAVSFDIDSGFIDPATDKATFDIHEVNEGQKTVTGVSSSSDVRRTPASPAEAALAKALGQAESGEPSVAIAGLTAVLSDASLSTAWRILALKSRAPLNTTVGVEDLPPGRDRDQHLIASMVDDQAWARLAPDAAVATFAVGRDLARLGAYFEALATFRSIESKWPDDEFQATIDISRVYREMGEYDRALATLDGFATQSHAEFGMKFHYHRGRVLLELGRATDAEKEFDAGLKDQPDYAWALAFLACAQAADGRVADALSSQRKAIVILGKSNRSARLNQGEIVDLARATDVAERLRAASSLSQPTRIAGLCEGYWDDGDGHRDRSSLLPPATTRTD